MEIPIKNIEDVHKLQEVMWNIIEENRELKRIAKVIDNIAYYYKIGIMVETMEDGEIIPLTLSNEVRDGIVANLRYQYDIVHSSLKNNMRLAKHYSDKVNENI